VTDNNVGRRYIENRLGVAAINARQAPNTLTERVQQAIDGDPAVDTVLPATDAAEGEEEASDDAVGDTEPLSMTG
jgi:hypothetical protein